YCLMSWVQPAEALRHAEQAVAYAEEHEEHTFASYAGMIVAWLRLRAGEWDEAGRVACDELEQGSTVAQLLARTVLTELAVRRGAPAADERLAELAALADRAGELQRLAPVLELQTERALTGGAPLPTGRFASVADEIRRRGSLAGYAAVRIAAWAAV